MPNKLRIGTAWLADQAKTHASESIRYRRGAVTSDPIAAVIGYTTFEADDSRGVTIVSQIRDYLVVADDLELAGQVIVPQSGDVILETDSGGVIVWRHEVSRVGNEPCWRWSDAFNTRRRIHTKTVGVES